jgi:hypothetical protein
MLEITIPEIEEYDDEKNLFLYSKEQVLQLEHSLVSLSKWESKYCKPFLVKSEKTVEESLDYVRCMTLNLNIDPMVYRLISKEDMDTIARYIELPMSATTFSKDEKKGQSKEVITSEIIYYWMIILNVPMVCENWHLNRLLTLINVCNIKNQPAKNLSKKQVMDQNRSLNEARRKALNSKG